MKVQAPARNSAIALSVATGAAGYVFAAFLNDLPSSPVRDALMLGYPLLVGLVLGLARTDIRAVPGSWLGIVGVGALYIFVGAYQPPAEGDLALAAMWLVAIALMILAGFGIGHVIRSANRGTRHASRDLGHRP